MIIIVERASSLFVGFSCVRQIKKPRSGAVFFGVDKELMLAKVAIFVLTFFCCVKINIYSRTFIWLVLGFNCIDYYAENAYCSNDNRRDKNCFHMFTFIPIITLRQAVLGGRQVCLLVDLMLINHLLVLR